MNAPRLSKIELTAIRNAVRAALREDLGARGDVTSLATTPPASASRARILAKEDGVRCGLPVAEAAFRALDPRARIRRLARDGQAVRRGQFVLEVTGRTRALLSAERTALNFVQRLSGTATMARRFTEAARRAAGRKAPRILDTRKTTPGLRALEKYAVRCGGATNHRMGLHDMVLIKDNHLAAVAHLPKPIVGAVNRARRRWPGLRVEVECDTLAQVREAVDSRADIILLDNMSNARLRAAVKLVAGRARTEASGGVNLKTLPGIARTGVDFISVGALTHSARALDFSLELEQLG